MRTILLSVILTLAFVASASAQVVSNDYGSPITQESKATDSDEKETFSYAAFGFYSFKGGNNYGLSYLDLTPNGVGMDLNMRAEFKDHGNYNVDLGINYSFQIWGNNESNLLLTAAVGPSFRMQDEYDYKKDKWNDSKFFVDLYINPRVTFHYNRFAISAGYFLWAAKFKFSNGYKADGFHATIGYSF